MTDDGRSAGDLLSLVNRLTGTPDPRSPNGVIGDPGSAVVGVQEDRGGRLVGNEDDTPGAVVPLAAMDPAFHEYLATGLFGGMFTNSDDEADESLYWTPTDNDQVAWDCLADPDVPGGFKWRYVTTAVTPASPALLTSAAVPAVDLFGVGVAVYYSLYAAGPSIDARIIWTDEDGAVVQEDFIDGGTLALGERQYKVLGVTTPPAANAAFVAIQLEVTHFGATGAGDTLDIFGVVMRPLLPPATVLDPAAPLFLSNLDAQPASNRYVPATGISAGELALLYLYATRLWISRNGEHAPLTFAGARATKSATQSVNDSAWADVTWSTDAHDTDAYHDTGSNTERFVVATPGYYRLTATVAFDADADGFRRLRITNQAGTVLAQVTVPSVGGGVRTCVPIDSGWVALDTGHWLKVEAYHTAGAALNIDNGDGTHASLEFRPE